MHVCMYGENFHSSVFCLLLLELIIVIDIIIIVIIIK